MSNMQIINIIAWLANQKFISDKCLVCKILTLSDIDIIII